MRNIILTIVSIFIYINLFAQFGGGTGTESDPYRIYTIAHLEEIGDSMVNGNHLCNIHFRLMNDIVDDSITNTLGGYWDSHAWQSGFGGSLHGSGHRVALNIMADNNRDVALFYNIDSTGYVDSLSIVGNLFTSGSNHSQRLSAGICIFNRGTIYQCVSKLQVGNIGFFGGIACENLGNIISCTNYTNTSYSSVGGICCRGFSCHIVDCKNYGNFKIHGEETGGICGRVCHVAYNNTDVNIIGCTNYGEISSGQSYGEFSSNVGGIIGHCDIDAQTTTAKCKIKNCQNFGTVQADSSIYVGGIVGGEIMGPVSIENCANYGDVTGMYNVGGIAGEYFGNDPLWVIEDEGYTYPTGRIINCYNFGYIQGESAVGGIAGSFASYCGDTLAHCLNIGKVEGSAICSGNYDYEGWDLGDSIYYDSNYYDAQMLVDTSANEEGMYEWRFTSQLTGDTPELRAMLGDGWSYAEGRYPIPLGLENDSLAMLFATPIYLRVISDDNYDHTNLVRNNFTVGTENGVSWSSGDRLSIDGENATILASGSENVTANLAGYSFTRRLNLINPVIVEEQEFDDIKIFPNPATNILNITSSETISEIEIVNVMGQVVKRIEGNSDNAVCDVEDLKAGVYMVRIYNNPLTEPVEVAVSQRKFIKE